MGLEDLREGVGCPAVSREVMVVRTSTVERHYEGRSRSVSEAK